MAGELVFGEGSNVTEICDLLIGLGRGRRKSFYTAPQGLAPLNFKELDGTLHSSFLSALPSGEIDRLEVIIPQTLNPFPLFVPTGAPQTLKGWCLLGEL